MGGSLDDLARWGSLAVDAAAHRLTLGGFGPPFFSSFSAAKSYMVLCGTSKLAAPEALSGVSRT